MPYRMLALVALAICGAPTAFAEQGDWTLPRTPWGDPDMQGVWTNETITPFERPVEQEGKKFLSDAEAAEIEADVARRRAASDGTSPPGSVGGYNQFWLDSGTEFLPTHQTSLVVDPASGRVPTRPSAEARRDFNRARQGDSFVYMSVWDRCIHRRASGRSRHEELESGNAEGVLHVHGHQADPNPVPGGRRDAVADSPLPGFPGSVLIGNAPDLIDPAGVVVGRNRKLGPGHASGFSDCNRSFRTTRR